MQVPNFGVRAQRVRIEYNLISGLKIYGKDCRIIILLEFKVVK